MEYFKSFSQADIIELIQSTKRELFLCLPAIHSEVETAIGYLANSSNFDGKKIEIHILVDFDANTFRQGYGDFEAVERLWRGEFDVRTLPSNRISFIISDEVGYYLFMESRSMIPADKATINAIRIDPVSQVRLKRYFFSSEDQKAFEDELTNAIIEESILLNQAKTLVDQNIAPVSRISEEEIEEISEDLSANPPLNPDYKRLVEFYSNKFQYVRLKFEGSNLQHRKIELPAKALPIVDAALRERLETKLNLFDKKKYKSVFSPLEKFKEDIEALRKKYLKKVKSREESILNKLNKQIFNSDLNTLVQRITQVQKDLLMGTTNLINQTKENLLIELVNFLKENPKALFPDYPNLWQNNAEYVEELAKVKAKEIIFKIRWPEAHLLVSEFKLEAQYSDITIEDLKNKQFIAELKDCGLIKDEDVSQLAEFGKGIETR